MTRKVLFDALFGDYDFDVPPDEFDSYIRAEPDRYEIHNGMWNRDDIQKVYENNPTLLRCFVLFNPADPEKLIPIKTTLLPENNIFYNQRLDEGWEIKAASVFRIERA